MIILRPHNVKKCLENCLISTKYEVILDAYVYYMVLRCRCVSILSTPQNQKTFINQIFKSKPFDA